MTSTGLVLVLVTAAMTMAANLMLRAGIEAAGGFAANRLIEMVAEVAKLFGEPFFAAGFLLYFLSSLVWFRVVASEPLSVAYPLLVSLTFSLVTAGAVLVYHESLSLQKMIGLATVLAGIVLISMDEAA